jgi:hypothetical protein
MSIENGLHKSWMAWSRPSSPISCLYLSKDEMACHWFGFRRTNRARQ